jgi:hypothetical protein
VSRLKYLEFFLGSARITLGKISPSRRRVTAVGHGIHRAADGNIAGAWCHAICPACASGEISAGGGFGDVRGKNGWGARREQAEAHNKSGNCVVAAHLWVLSAALNHWFIKLCLQDSCQQQFATVFGQSTSSIPLACRDTQEPHLKVIAITIGKNAKVLKLNPRISAWPETQRSASAGQK